MTRFFCNDCKVVGHLMKGKSGHLAKTIFKFLHADKSSCTVVVTGKVVNRGNGKGIHVPCTLHFKRHQQFIDILKWG